MKTCSIRKRRVLGATASGQRMVYRVRTALGREVDGDRPSTRS